ncbi:hypothetical protein [Thermococcus celer]|uniref:hypothetical protein n=1 Tax=Thermococcus celer TaxID=2264 RepID=UPI0012FF8C14|nr:hypothetical protein [Thermococcus celer]
MPSILVVGVLPHDSGKTTLATSLVREAVEDGHGPSCTHGKSWSSDRENGESLRRSSECWGGWALISVSKSPLHRSKYRSCSRSCLEGIYRAKSFFYQKLFNCYKIIHCKERRWRKWSGL